MEIKSAPNVPPGYYNTMPGYEETLVNGEGLLPPPVPLAALPALSNLPAQTDWKITFESEYLTEQSSGLHSENLSKVSGTTLFTDTQYMLYPVVGFPDPSINQESDRLIREHQSKYFQTSRILQQRHTIELIPVTKVNYVWHGESYTYIVYGNENCVYTDNYPATCCCSVIRASSSPSAVGTPACPVQPPCPNRLEYRLETFAETRCTEWSDEPYIGQPEDAFLQPPPAPWTLTAQAPAFFQDRRQDIRVPYTSSVKTCHACMGKGNMLCTTCSGSGDVMCMTCYESGQCEERKICMMCSGLGRQNFQNICWTCGGSGYIYETELCFPCSGSGRKICGRCHGKLFCVCSKCEGREKLLVFINLKIHWITYKSEYLTEQSSGLHSENIWKVSGSTIFTDTQYMLHPLVGFPDPTINQESDRLIRKHQSKYFQTCRILQQRHTIELIPVTKVNYTWHGESYTYIVYGNENCVYTDNYPATCCCSV
ncbi:protein SSUH2 isoform X2, partial [Clarias magur]